MPTSEQELEKFYKTLQGRGAAPLTPDHEYYVPILGDNIAKDPILRLKRRISLADSESVNLLTGFRGNGKSTELLRLKKILEDQGCLVILVDMLNYLLMHKPVELSDFTLSLMAALSEAAADPKQTAGFDLQPLTTSYWQRLTSFLQSEVEVEKFGFKSGAGGVTANLGMKLKTEPHFKKKIQRHLRGHLTRLVQDANEFVATLIQEIRRQSNDPDKKIVLLVDSVEQIRGQGDEAHKVHTSVRELFSGQAAKLAFPMLHVVYTVPPYLMALSQNMGRTLGGHPISQWPNIHVRTRKDNEPDEDGIKVMKEIVAHRYPHWQDVFAIQDLAYLAHISGGDLRDFFRLIRESLLTAMLTPEPEKFVTREYIKMAVLQLRNEMLPLADKDARWLVKIHNSKQEQLAEVADLPDLARYLDTNLIMNYLNGEPWYDIHPVLIDEIKARGFFDEAEVKQ